MDAMTPEFVSGVEQGVAAVRARIAALREEIRRLEASIGIGSEPESRPAPRMNPRPRLPGGNPVPPPPPSDRETERAIMETKMRTNQPTGAPSDIQALRELLRQGPGVASAR